MPSQRMRWGTLASRHITQEVVAPSHSAALGRRRRASGVEASRRASPRLRISFRALGDAPLAIASLDRVVDGPTIAKLKDKSYRANRVPLFEAVDQTVRASVRYP